MPTLMPNARVVVGPVPRMNTRRVLETRPERRGWNWVWDGMSGGMREGMMVPVYPALALRVPRAMPVIVIPIAAKTEPDDANADGRPIGQQRNMDTLVWVDDVACMQPAAVGADRYVTPAVIAHAALNGDVDTCAKDGHHRVITGRPGPQIDLSRHVGQLLRLHRCWQRRQGGKHDQHGPD